MKCMHCNNKVDPKYQWNRSGYIWCCECCYRQDYHWLKEMKKQGRIPKKRDNYKHV